jgi:hypothetical protein
VDAQTQAELTTALADLELLVFGSAAEDESLVARVLAADTTFTAYVVARLAREQIILH